MRVIREDLLECIAVRVMQLLGCSSDDESIVATLLDFSAGSTEKMVVVARSTSERELGMYYTDENSVAFASIREAAPVVEDDVRRSLRFAKLGPKPYRSVLGVPISRKGRAFAGIAIDSDRVYAFFGRGPGIAVEIEQYIGLLSMTYLDDANSVECAYDPRSLQGVPR